MHAMFISLHVAVSREYVRIPMKQPHNSPVKGVLLFLLYQERTEAKGAHHLNLAVEKVRSLFSEQKVVGISRRQLIPYIGDTPIMNQLVELTSFPQIQRYCST